MKQGGNQVDSETEEDFVALALVIVNCIKGSVILIKFPCKIGKIISRMYFISTSTSYKYHNVEKISLFPYKKWDVDILVFLTVIVIVIDLLSFKQSASTYFQLKT